MDSIICLELKEEKAKEYYLKMKDIFKKIINNDQEEFINREEFNWDEVEKRHCETMQEMYKSGEELFAHNVQRKEDHRFYALNISNNFSDFGLCYQPESEDLFCCDLVEFFDYRGDKTIVLSFTYNKKTDEITDIYMLYRSSSPMLDKKIIRSAEDKTLKKIL